MGNRSAVSRMSRGKSVNDGSGPYPRSIVLPVWIDMRAPYDISVFKMRAKQLGLEAAVGVRGARGRRAAVAVMKAALTRPRPVVGHGGRREGAGRKPKGARDEK